MTNPPKLSGIIAFGVYEADLRSGELRRQGVKLKVQEKPFQVLAILLERPGEVVSREELRERLWASDTFVDFDHGLNTAVNKLREVLSDSASNPRFIETLPRRGYRFIASVRPVNPEIRGDKPDPETPARGAALSNPPTAPLASGPALADKSPAASLTRMIDPEAEELPSAPRPLIRTILVMTQLGYLVMYIFALHAFFSRYVERSELTVVFSWLPEVLMWVAIISLPLRLYLFFAISFDYALLYGKFRRLFPVLFILDELWALSPFLILPKLGVGITFVAVASFVYLPFAQRTLMWMSYGNSSR